MDGRRETSSPLKVCLFGAFDAHVHGQPLPRLRTRRGRWLLALLVLRHDREVERGWLAGTLWPESSERDALRSLRQTLADLRRERLKDIHVSAVCPDGIWTPMIADKLDDPDAAPSFSGQLMRPEQVAPKVAELLDRPRPVLALPRWRGVFVRVVDAFPGLFAHTIPLWMADARRRQRRWKKLIEAGRGP